MSISKQNVKRFCKEFENIENYQEAVSSPDQWDCHHRNEIDMNLSLTELKEMGLYYNRPASELIFITHRDHVSLHNKGNKIRLGKHHSIETKKKISDSRKGKIHSMESRKKMSDSKKGNKNRYKFICPIKLTYMYCKLGMSIDKIAQELMVGRNTIDRHLKELNIPIRPAHRPSRK